MKKKSKLAMIGLILLLLLSCSVLSQTGNNQETNITEQLHNTQQAQNTISAIDGMPMALVPEGTFTMGSANDPHAEADEFPQHDVFLSAYWIDVTEVTNEMFAKFLNDGNEIETLGQFAWFDAKAKSVKIRYENGVWSVIPGFETHPVVEVNWHAANTYCEWAGRRLPTEAEWEKAARGSDQRIYPWGNEISCENAQYDACGGETKPVGSYPSGTSPYGVLDMAGNVWEWVADHYDDGYYQRSDLIDPQGPETEFYVIRGGSWSNSYWGLRTAGRGNKNPNLTLSNLGFRCAMDVEFLEEEVTKQANVTTDTPQIQTVELWKTYQVEDAIWDLAWSPDNRFILAQQYINEFVIFDIDTGNTWPPINIEGTWVPAIGGQWSPDGSMLSVFTNSEVYILNSQASDFMHSFKTGVWVVQIDWTPDSQIITVALGNDKIMLVEAESGKQLTTIEAEFNDIVSIAWSPDGSKLAIETSDHLYIWDRNSQTILQTFEVLFSPVWSPNGRTIAGHHWSILELLNMETGEQQSISTPRFSATIGPPLIAWSPDGKIIATANENEINLWDAENGFERITKLSTHTSPVYSLAFSPDGTYLASASNDGMLNIWIIP